MHRLRLLILALSFALAAPCRSQSTPPACKLPTPTPASSRPPTPRPTAAAIQAAADAEAADPSVLTASEPPNFAVIRYRLLDYYDCVGSSGCYWNDIDAQDRRADAELSRLLALHHANTPAEARAQKLALVLDIDETALTSYCEEKREDLGYIPSIFERWIVTPEASIPIPGTLRLFNHARAAGVAVFFITGRPGKGTPNDQTAATTRNLAAAGYQGWQGLILHDPTYPTKDTTTYKSEARASLIARGYRIILNVGDQWSDLKGPSRAEISVKLPDPFYYLP